MKEHRAVVVVRSDLPYHEVLSAIVGAVRDQFPGPVQAQGYDPKKVEKQLHDAVRERNAAVSQAHQLQMEVLHLRSLVNAGPIEQMEEEARSIEQLHEEEYKKHRAARGRVRPD